MVKERIRIPLPWSGRYYDINMDEVKVGRLGISIGWLVAHRQLYFRVGLAPRFL